MPPLTIANRYVFEDGGNRTAVLEKSGVLVTMIDGLEKWAHANDYLEDQGLSPESSESGLVDTLSSLFGTAHTDGEPVQEPAVAKKRGRPKKDTVPAPTPPDAPDWVKSAAERRAEQPQVQETEAEGDGPILYLYHRNRATGDRVRLGEVSLKDLPEHIQKAFREV